MATTDPAVQSSSRSETPVVNDFSIQVATVNGSGSQTANLVLIRSLVTVQMHTPFLARIWNQPGHNRT